MWNVIYSPNFSSWLQSLDDDEQDSVYHGIDLLEQLGPHLGRPNADTIKGSQLSNLKELRIQHDGKPYRAFYVFDPIRQAVMLCGGDKTGDKRFYKKMIPLAESIYADYLQENDL
ncbi:type II toxin-antitoxin system RelE/ParE family toxin [Moraxella nasicaprae]|uniref:Type II toxin-antitoxin system RelE/ParE family toxin n=1 Tax=Moraxella nasicaprae TaxID=2904122 RepID=A0ABY6F382_9GAMM|nr:type II toxin-antitoxin system RelE/ParE family toxin [Moraxella nasicaprae]UXZ04554.1 type II toxin-antitoxin system RelE/ParE family toxin [Moraxella nasicaprae]